jgi:hypothetical protein
MKSGEQRPGTRGWRGHRIPSNTAAGPLRTLTAGALQSLDHLARALHTSRARAADILLERLLAVGEACGGPLQAIAAMEKLDHAKAQRREETQDSRGAAETRGDEMPAAIRSELAALDTMRQSLERHGLLP